MKVRVMAIRIFQILAVLGILLLALLVALMLPDCARLRAMIINSNSSPIEDITLKIRDEVIWSGGLKRFEARRFNLALYTNGIFEVEGRYVESDKRLKGRSGYVISHDGQMHLLVIEDDGVHYVSWADPPMPRLDKEDFWDSVTVLWIWGSEFMGCADHDLWKRLKG